MTVQKQDGLLVVHATGTNLFFVGEGEPGEFLSRNVAASGPPMRAVLHVDATMEEIIAVRGVFRFHEAQRWALMRLPAEAVAEVAEAEVAYAGCMRSSSGTMQKLCSLARISHEQLARALGISGKAFSFWLNAGFPMPVFRLAEELISRGSVPASP